MGQFTAYRQQGIHTHTHMLDIKKEFIERSSLGGVSWLGGITWKYIDRTFLERMFCFFGI